MQSSQVSCSCYLLNSSVTLRLVYLSPRRTVHADHQIFWGVPLENIAATPNSEAIKGGLPGKLRNRKKDGVTGNAGVAFRGSKEEFCRDALAQPGSAATRSTSGLP
jgi:hypothetical protein